MQKISGLNLKNTTVVLDDKHFIDCTMDGCLLEYSGHGIILETTMFTGCRFLFLEDAGRTIALLNQFGMLLGPHTAVSSSSGVN